MAMRARIFDEWVCEMLKKNPNAIVSHIGCGLDSRFLRVNEKYQTWIDADFSDVIDTRKKNILKMKIIRCVHLTQQSRRK